MIAEWHWSKSAKLNIIHLQVKISPAVLYKYKYITNLKLLLQNDSSKQCKSNTFNNFLEINTFKERIKESGS